MNICRYWVSDKQEGHLHLEFIISSFPRQRVQVLLQDDISTKLSKEIYRNIIKFGLHQEVMRTPVLSCPNVIEWITRIVDHENREILNFEDKSVAGY